MQFTGAFMCGILSHEANNLLKLIDPVQVTGHTVCFIPRVLEILSLMDPFVARGWFMCSL